MMDVVCSPIILTHDDTPYSYPSLRMIQHWKHEHYTAWCIYRDKTYLVSRRLRRWWWENDGLSHFIQMNVAAISNIRQWCTATTSADAEIASTGVRFVKSAASVLRTAIGVRQGWKCIFLTKVKLSALRRQIQQPYSSNSGSSYRSNLCKHTRTINLMSFVTRWLERGHPT